MFSIRSLLPFWRKKSDPSLEMYPSFTARLFATLVDMLLSLIILVPIFYFLAGVLCPHDLPSEKFSKIKVEAAKKVEGMHKLDVVKPGSLDNEIWEHIQKDPRYEQLMKEGGLKAVLMQRAAESVLLLFVTFCFWMKTHSTPGKMLLSMKIVDVKTMKPAGTFELIVRMVSYPLSVLPLGAGIFYVAFNKKHRAWHDLISGTVVVYKHGHASKWFRFL